MNFARTLLLPVLLLGGLVDVASAQYRHIFPQFAFGGGWESTLTAVSGVNDNTTCTFSAQGRFLTMRDHLGNSRTGTALTLQGAFNFLKTETPGLAASSGMAVLDCNNEVIAANTLFSLEVGGSLVSEALVESAEEVVAGPDSFAWFPADHRGGARFGVAVANPSPQPLDVIVTMFDTGMQTVVNATVNVPANTSKAFFVDELGTVPPDLFGQVLISPSNNLGPSLYAIGLRFTALVFTTIPAIVYPRTTATPDNPAALWSHSGTGNTVFDKPTSATRVRVIGEYDGFVQNFIVRCGGSSIINTIIGTSGVADVLRYEGVHNMGQCGEVEIVSSEGVSWSFTEVR